MIEAIAAKLERTLAQALAPGEEVIVKLRGVFKEALVCTDTRVIILKAGWMTGQLFGTNILQSPYPNVAGAQVTFHLLTGYFELSTGGMQNSPKSFWDSDKTVNAAKSPNCVSISGQEQASKFRDACAFIMRKASILERGESQPSRDALEALERLAKLRDSGVISSAEFQAKKAQLLARV